MFEVELLGLLNRYKKSSDKEEQKKLKSSIIDLVNDLKEDLEHFLSSAEIDDETKKFLESCIINKPVEGKEKELQESKKVQEISEENPKDVEIIMDYYKNWLDSYHRNSEQISDECSKIIDDILNFYIVNGFAVLEQIILMEDTEDFEKFKNHLKNKIRAHFGQKIGTYLEGPYKELSFFAKLKKKREIKNLLNEIGHYKFNTKKVAEVLK